jgi:hypothetical protein
VTDQAGTAPPQPASVKPNRSLDWIHPVVVGIAVTFFAAVGVGMFIVGLFAMFVPFVFLVPLLPVGLLVLLGVISRGMLGRSFWWWNVVIVALLVWLTITLYAVQAPAVLFAGRDVAPLIVGAAGAAMSLVLHARPLRIVGLGAILITLAAVCAPVVLDQSAQQQAAAAADEAEYRAGLAGTVRPYTVPGFGIRFSAFSSDHSRMGLSTDPNAAPDDDHELDTGDVLIETSRLYTLEDLEGQACRTRNTMGLEDAVIECRALGNDTWERVIDGERAVVRVVEDRLVTLTGVGELETLARTLEPLDHATFDRRLREQWDGSNEL